MIYQLPNGRIIELSVEQFLDLDDTDIKDLNGLSTSYSHECNNPFYNLFSTTQILDATVIPEELLEDEEFIEDLFINEVPDEYTDDYFHRDDI